MARSHQGETMDQMIATTVSAVRWERGLGFAGIVLAGLAAGVPVAALADPPGTDFGAPVVAATPVLANEVVAAQLLGKLFTVNSTESQTAPAVIPQLGSALDPSGAVQSDQPLGATTTANNGFFQPLGSNGRSCFTCHQPQDGWTVSVQHIRDRFNADPNDPLFQPIDAATCPTDDVSTPQAQLSAYSLLLDKGLIRIGLPMPAPLQYKIANVQDPYGCNTNNTTGLTSQTTGIISTYRRPLPTTSLGFLSTIMWDGREPNLFSQAVVATQTHEQAAAPPTNAQQQEMIGFEGCSAALTPDACANTLAGAGIFTAQYFDNRALYLNDGVNGGPIGLAAQLAVFFVGINDPFGQNPTKAPFTPNVFDLYTPWGALQGQSDEIDARESIARGQVLFNTIPINITGVAGLNDVLGQPTIVGSCSTCHDNPNAGNHSVGLLLNTGVTGAGATRPPILQIDGLPVFTATCTTGPLAGQTVQVTDPGSATVTGNCADLGKVKVPILRGLAARAPYFHNGSAPTLGYVARFYDQRFGIGLTDQQQNDLIAFLNSL
jgi:cytochrome c peroxidase